MNRCDVNIALSLQIQYDTQQTNHEKYHTNSIFNDFPTKIIIFSI